MRRLATVSFALTLGVLAVAPATAPAQSTGADSVSGDASERLELFEPVPGVINCRRLLSLNVEVESGPSGEHPTGTVLLLSGGPTPGGTFSATTNATCLSVSGHVAIIGLSGNVHQGGLGFDFGMAGLVPGSGWRGTELRCRQRRVRLPDGRRPFGPPLPGPTTCSTFPATFFTDTFAFPDFTNAEGDVVVTDTVPFPTSKNQCKNGGWRKSGVFKNQGECVSFVATKGKNQPAGH